MSRRKLAVAQRVSGAEFDRLSLEFDAPGMIHGLGRIIAEIEDHLLQLLRFAGDDGSCRGFADREFDSRRQRHLQQ